MGLFEVCVRTNQKSYERTTNTYFKSKIMDIAHYGSNRYILYAVRQHI